MESPELIPRRKLSQAVLERLLQRIRGGEFAPGAQLPSERELMESYGVGRPAIREALQNLERAGILVITHGERARVAVPTAGNLIQQLADGTRHLLNVEPHNLEHLKDARLLLETGVARRAAEHASPEAVELLEERYADQLLSVSDRQEFVTKDMAFHRQIAAITGNPIFPTLIEAMFEWMGAFYTQLISAPGAENLTMTEHRRILDAIAAHDPAEAEAAMRDHLTRANELYRQFEVS